MDLFVWKTTFDTASSLMTHVFSDCVSIITDFKSKKSKVYKDGKVIRTFDCDITVSTYTIFLSSVARDAEILETFKGKGE